MHVHIFDVQKRGDEPPATADTIATDADLLLPFAANGVLQVFNLSASPASLRQRDAVERGEIFGPRQALAFLIDGNPPMAGGGLAKTASTPEEGRAAVREARAAGYEAIKTYSALDFDTFQAIREEAVALGMKVMGHIPLRGAGRTEDLLAPGFSMVAHSEEFAYQLPEITPESSSAAIPRFAALARERGVWLDTTLILNERVVERTANPEQLMQRPELRYIHPAIVAYWRDHNSYAASLDKLPRRRAVAAFNPQLIRAFADAGVPIVTGTDTGIAGIMPGFGLLDELEGLARIGLPNHRILEAATRLPAEYLGVAGDRGTVEQGKRADLILLDADPREDIANVRRLSAVFLDGRLYRKPDIDARLDALARRYASAGKQQAAIPEGGEFGHDDH